MNYKLKCLVCLIAISLISCNNNDVLSYENKLVEAFEKSEATNKPLFINFTGHACMSTNEFDDTFIKSRRIQKLLDKHYVSLFLYVDEFKSIERIDTTNYYKIVPNLNKTKKKIKTIGNLNSTIQIQLYNFIAQPLYIVADAKGKPIIEPFQFMHKDEAAFFQKLIEGLEVYNATQ